MRYLPSLSPGAQKYTRNISWVIVEKVFRLAAGLFVGLYAARYLGPARFGVLNFVISYAAFFSEIARCGFDSIVIRDLVKSSINEKTLILGTAFRLKMFAGVFAGIASILSALFFCGSRDEIAFIAIVSLGFTFQAAEVIDYYFQSEVKLRFVSIARLLQLILSSTAKLICVHLEMELIWFILIILIDQITLSFFLWYTYRKVSPETFFGKFNLVYAKRLIKDSWPLLLAAITVTFYMRIDQIMLKAILGDTEVGLYSAATKISELWYFIPMTICSTLFPSIVAARQESMEKYQRRIQGQFDLVTWISIGPILIVAFFSNFIVNTLYGSAFSGSSIVLAITMVALLPISLGVARSNWLIAEGLITLSTAFVAFGAVSKFAFNLIFIPATGIVGAGVATLASQCTVAFIAPLFFRPSRPTLILFLKSLYLPGSARRLLRGAWR